MEGPFNCLSNSGSHPTENTIPVASEQKQALALFRYLFLGSKLLLHSIKDMYYISKQGRILFWFHLQFQSNFTDLLTKSLQG